MVGPRRPQRAAEADFQHAGPRENDLNGLAVSSQPVTVSAEKAFPIAQLPANGCRLPAHFPGPPAFWSAFAAPSGKSVGGGRHPARSAPGGRFQSAE